MLLLSCRLHQLALLNMLFLVLYSCFLFFYFARASSIPKTKLATTQTLNTRARISHDFCEEYERDYLDALLVEVNIWSRSALYHTADQPRNEWDATLFRVHFRRKFNDVSNEERYRRYVRERIYTVLDETERSPQGRILLQCDNPNPQQQKCDAEAILELAPVEAKIIVVSWKSILHFVFDRCLV